VFQAEDGIRDFHVTGVQTCALPIWRHRRPAPRHQALMLLTGLLAGVEAGLNRVLRLDATALPRLQKLAGKVIAVHAQSPAFDLYLLPGGDGLQLAAQWQAEADCTLEAPASSLLRLALSADKTAVLHAPELSLSGDSAALL